MDARFQDHFNTMFGQQGPGGAENKPVSLDGINANHVKAFVERTMKEYNLTPRDLAVTLQEQVRQGYAVNKKTKQKVQLSMPQTALYPHIVSWIVQRYKLNQQ